MKYRILLLISCLLAVFSFSPAYCGEAELLNEAAKELAAKKENTPEVRQQLTLGHAATALAAAQEALKEGNEKEAKKNKKKAMRWAVQAVRECSDPGEAPGKIGEALVEEGGMSQNALNRFTDLLDDLVAAKKRHGHQPDYAGTGPADHRRIRRLAPQQGHQVVS